MNSNTKVGCERCSRLIKKTLERRKPIVIVHFVKSQQTVSPTVPLQRTAGKATSKNLNFSCLENNSVQ